MNGRAVVLLSGGLDSTLAVKMMLDQGVETPAVHCQGVRSEYVARNDRASDL